MKRAFICFSVMGCILGLSSLALAADNTSQTVTIQVSQINQISVSGNPAALTVSTATAGSQPAEVTDATTTYAVTTNANAARRVTGALDTDVPASTTLKINLAAPTGATSAGDVTLTTTAQSLVTGISKVAESGKTITYKFSATVAAGEVSSIAKTVTLTVTN
jgi:hypothetical protein